MNSQPLPERIQAISMQIIPILEGSGVIRSALFGSFVRGEATDKSDIDILVDLPRGKTLLDLVALRIKLEEKLQREVDLVTYNSLSPLLKDIILSEQIPIYERSKNLSSTHS